MMDGGYDQLKNYEAAKKYDAQAIIPLNLCNEKEPPAGFTSKWYCLLFHGLRNGLLGCR
jgi:hypothetical protein